jgi:hypothetical protein
MMRANLPGTPKLTKRSQLTPFNNCCATMYPDPPFTPWPGLAVARMEPVGLGHVGLQIAEEDGALAVRQRDAGRPGGVQIAQAPSGELRPELGVGLRGDEQGVGARIDVVAEAGEGQLLGPHQPGRSFRSSTRTLQPARDR